MPQKSDSTSKHFALYSWCFRGRGEHDRRKLCLVTLKNSYDEREVRNLATVQTIWARMTVGIGGGRMGRGDVRGRDNVHQQRLSIPRVGGTSAAPPQPHASSPSPPPVEYATRVGQTVDLQ